ncbi:MAG: VOC family protein [Coriobacteriales bacterium]|jgi:catechol 2,3-dioxygenase-like lactoylglutathione lyase family enzyme|nr:VOC family protein [Coriobacteriales bacterium]
MADSRQAAPDNRRQRKAVEMNLDLSIQHIDVHTNDLEESLRFYTEVLGFRYLFAPEADAEAPLELIWLRNDNGVVIELTRERRGDYDAEAVNRASATHVALRTPDIDAAMEWLRQNDVEIEFGPVQMAFAFDRELADETERSVFGYTDGKSAQMRLAFFRGPSGERFELLQDDLR